METTNLKIKETFTMVDNNLLSTPISKITAQQKLFISWILGWQKENKECFASNKTIAETLGLSKEGVKSLIKSCSHSFPTFFDCTPDTRDNGVPFHTITINLEELMKFLIEGKPVNKIKRRNKPSTENKTTESNITTEVIEEDIEEEIESEIEYKEEKYDLFNLVRNYITIDDIDGVDKIKDYMQSSLSSGYFTIKQIKNGLDIIKKDEDVTEELINKLKEAIK